MMYEHMAPVSVAEYVANMKLKTEKDLHNLSKRWQILQDILAKDEHTYDRQLSSFGEPILLQYDFSGMSTQHNLCLTLLLFLLIGFPLFFHTCHQKIINIINNIKK